MSMQLLSAQPPPPNDPSKPSAHLRSQGPSGSRRRPNPRPLAARPLSRGSFGSPSRHRSGQPAHLSYNTERRSADRPSPNPEKPDESLDHKNRTHQPAHHRRSGQAVYPPISSGAAIQ